MFATCAEDRYDLQQSIDKGDITVLGFEWKVEYLPLVDWMYKLLEIFISSYRTSMNTCMK